MIKLKQESNGNVQVLINNSIVYILLKSASRKRLPNKNGIVIVDTAGNKVEIETVELESYQEFGGAEMPFFGDVDDLFNITSLFFLDDSGSGGGGSGLGNTVYVDSTNSGGDGSLQNPYQYFEDAIDAAVSGDEIILAAGIYELDSIRDDGSKKWIKDGIIVTGPAATLYHSNILASPNSDVFSDDGSSVDCVINVRKILIDKGLPNFVELPTLNNLTSKLKIRCDDIEVNVGFKVENFDIFDIVADNILIKQGKGLEVFPPATITPTLLKFNAKNLLEKTNTFNSQPNWTLLYLRNIGPGVLDIQQRKVEVNCGNSDVIFMRIINIVNTTRFGWLRLTSSGTGALFNFLGSVRFNGDFRFTNTTCPNSGFGTAGMLMNGSFSLNGSCGAGGINISGGKFTNDGSKLVINLNIRTTTSCRVGGNSSTYVDLTGRINSGAADCLNGFTGATRHANLTKLQLITTSDYAFNSQGAGINMNVLDNVYCNTAVGIFRGVNFVEQVSNVVRDINLI